MGLKMQDSFRPSRAPFGGQIENCIGTTDYVGTVHKTKTHHYCVVAEKCYVGHNLTFMVVYQSSG